jgi:hypothetical protein
MTSEKSVERSIDTLQRIYSVIAALAINEGLKRVFLGQDGKFEFHSDHLPEFVAFVFTAVPFVHGMNRHLDQTLSTSRKQKRPRLLGFVFIDFFVFIIESALLFILGVSITSGADFYSWFAALLAVDIAWSLVTWPITKSVVIQWLLINVIAAIACLVLIYCVPPVFWKEWVLAAIAVLRTIADYKFAWLFYFPQEDVQAAPAAVPAV